MILMSFHTEHLDFRIWKYTVCTERCVVNTLYYDLSSLTSPAWKSILKHVFLHVLDINETELKRVFFNFQSFKLSLPIPSSKVLQFDIKILTEF